MAPATVRSKTSDGMEIKGAATALRTTLDLQDGVKYGLRTAGDAGHIVLIYRTDIPYLPSVLFDPVVHSHGEEFEEPGSGCVKAGCLIVSCEQKDRLPIWEPALWKG